VRALAPVILADDQPLGNAVLSPDLARATVLVADRSLLMNGAAIGCSYGTSAELRTRLPCGSWRTLVGGGSAAFN